MGREDNKQFGLLDKIDTSALSEMTPEQMVSQKDIAWRDNVMADPTFAGDLDNAIKSTSINTIIAINALLVLNEAIVRNKEKIR